LKEEKTDSKEPGPDGLPTGRAGRKTGFLKAGTRSRRAEAGYFASLILSKIQESLR